MSKYEPLTRYLKHQSRELVELTFSDIERIIGDKLPRSTHTHRALWSNNPVGHVMTQAWLEAGYRSEDVDMAEKRVTFRQQARSEDTQEQKPTGKELFDELFGCMRGTVHIPEGIDIMEPVELEWDAMRD